jgi:hypothetical protein
MDSDLAEILSQSLAGYASAAHSAIIDRALVREEISSHNKPEIILELTPAVISYRIFMTHQSVNRKFIEHFVDDVLIPVLKNSK